MRNRRLSLSLHERWILRSALELLMKANGFGANDKLVIEIGIESVRQLHEKLWDRELES